tara:strand:- start:351 stop:785 length:435 start_codon:yes stop_codon:yes gene_type:complete
MKEFNNEHLGKFLEIENDMEKSQAVEIVNSKDIELSKEIRDDDIKNDYDFRRKTLYDLVGQGQDALQSLLMLAKESEHPRAFEVAGQLIKANADLVQDLTKLQIDMNKIEDTKEGGPSKVVNNNSVFVGNTNELLEMLKGKNRE